MSRTQWGIIGLLAVALGVLVYASRDYFIPLPVAQASQIVELADGDTYDLIAAFVEKEINGRTERMLAYNGSIPGPLIKVAQGA